VGGDRRDDRSRAGSHADTALGDRADPEHLFALTERALDLAARGSLRPTIGQTFPLEDAAAAHPAIEARTAVGETLLLT
jgi:NADPH:quinone reductase-like Zn-dependent oxidoreductase